MPFFFFNKIAPFLFKKATLKYLKGHWSLIPHFFFRVLSEEDLVAITNKSHDNKTSFLIGSFMLMNGKHGNYCCDGDG